MSLLSFKRKNPRQFELFVGPIATDLLWPSQNVLDFIDSKTVCVRGLDIETEELAALADDLAKMFTPYAMNLPMTRLELIIAYGAAKNAIPFKIEK